MRVWRFPVVVSSIVVSVMVMVMSALPSIAVEPLGDDRKNGLGLYLWATGIDGKITVKGTEVPVDVGFDELFDSVEIAGSAGVSPERIALDPGLGFGKRLQDNYEILRNLWGLAELPYPLVVGLSRKSFTGSPTSSPPQERLPASLAGLSLATWGGADVVRVHDVQESHQALLFTEHVMGRR